WLGMRWSSVRRWLPRWCSCCHMLRRRCATLFPYTTLFRSPSDTATLLRLHPNHLPHLRRLAPKRLPHRLRVLRTLVATVGVYKRSEEHTSELQSRSNLVCRLPLAQKTAPGAPKPVYCPR